MTWRCKDQRIVVIKQVLCRDTTKILMGIQDRKQNQTQDSQTFYKAYTSQVESE